MFLCFMFMFHVQLILFYVYFYYRISWKQRKKNNKKYKIDPLNSSELEGWQARVSTGIGCHSETCSHFDNPLQAKKNPCLCLCYLLCLYSMFLCFHSTYQFCLCSYSTFLSYVSVLSLCLRFYSMFLPCVSVYVYVLCICSMFLSHVSVYVYVLYFYLTPLFHIPILRFFSW